jgi:hypothetical protein
MEYNNDSDHNPPTNDLEYYGNTLEHRNEDYDPIINAMFLNKLDPTFYTM